MLEQKIPPSAILVVFSLFVDLPAQAMVIDNFTDGGVMLSTPGPKVEDMQTGLDPDSILGTSRGITYNAIKRFSSGENGNVVVEVDTSDGVFRHTPDTGMTAANFSMEYGTSPSSRVAGGTPMSEDFTADGADRLVFNFLSTSENPGPWTDGQVAFDLLIESASGANYYGFHRVNVSAQPFACEIMFADILATRPTLDLAAVTYFSFATSNGTFEGPLELASIMTGSAPPLLGDADGDGDVDTFDITAVKQNFGNTGAAGGSLLGDADGDGDVDAFDLTAVEQNFGSTSGSSSAISAASIPEPSSVMLLSITGVLMIQRRGRAV